MEISALEAQSVQSEHDQADIAGAQPTTQATPDTCVYEAREQFVPFHERDQRFACIVTHRRAGKTVACVHELQRAATSCTLLRPRFAYVAPFMRQAKAVGVGLSPRRRGAAA